MQEALEAGTALGKWTIEKKIGDGGMSSTYVVRAAKGRDRTHFAAKVIDTTTDPKHLARLRAEYETLASLRHANIVRVHDWGEDKRRALAYYVMDYVPGCSITDYIRRVWMPVGETLELYRTVLEAVAYLHSQQVTHRDLKPSNILVEGAGRVTLIDFGIARGPHRPEITGKYDVSLTPMVASPEQALVYLGADHVSDTARALAASPRTDVYALGVLLYHLLTNNWPNGYEGTSEKELTDYLHRVATRCPRLPAGGDVPPTVARIALAMLQPRFADRPANAGMVLPMFDAAVNADEEFMDGTSPLVERQFQAAMHSDGMVPTQPHIPPPPPSWRAAFSYLGSAAAGALLVFSLVGLQARPPAAPLMLDRDPSAVADPSTPSPQVLSGIADAGNLLQDLLLTATVITGPVAGQKRYPCTRGQHEAPWKGGCWRIFAMEAKEDCDSTGTVVYEPEAGYCKKYLLGYFPVWLKDSPKPTPSTLDPVNPEGARVPMDSKGF